MKCPQSEAETTKVGAFWGCPTHGQLPETNTMRIVTSPNVLLQVLIPIMLREPFFVCILGQRYGWVPESGQFRHTTIQQMRPKVLAHE